MLPEIPNGVLGLIGISGGSYIGAKVIQKVGEAPKTDQVAPQTQAAVAPAQPQPLTQPQPTMP
jgi:hypothetical protein